VRVPKLVEIKPTSCEELMIPIDMVESLSSRLTMIVLPDADGRELRLGSLWATQPAVMVFLRHYG